MLNIIMLVIGLASLVLGCVLTVVVSRRRPIGDLRMDTSDPDGPYLFLELSKDGIDEIYTRRYVTLRVKIKSQH